MIATIVNLQGGFPFTPAWAGNVTNNGEAARPLRICDGSLDNPTLDRWFDTSCFVQPEAFTHGNTGRNILRGDAQENFDLAVYKNINIKEGHRIQFRAEFFNALNHPIFTRPAATINTPAAGTINNSNEGRVVQFGVKYNF